MRGIHSMKRRPAPAGSEPANDNTVLPNQRRTIKGGAGPSIARERSANGGPGTERFRVGPRPLMIAAFAGLILVALSGAFLIGLAAVGVFAIVIGAVELVRHHLARRQLAAEHTARSTAR